MSTGLTTFPKHGVVYRVSNRHLIVNSGYLEKLLPGDIVLADRGFDIGDDVVRMQASLKFPAFSYTWT